ncbi:MAG: UDP-2,4-diacetamido-2,4,6-trideoxy-beta-L-altropyranose hydrolase [Thiotrichales bacterium]|nr:UDP-2,4-diacetamido-2,4,6-trideoxy-beta-L-altropyranose hydrolase [Thiotrichales bacterium]
MKVVFRTDASIHIGTGHIMRCLTLAKALQEQGVEVAFICRAHLGHLLAKIEQAGFVGYSLPIESDVAHTEKVAEALTHAAWLGATQQQDAKACQSILEPLHPDWLIVDHYALDAHWHAMLKPFVGQLMVIDDLGDRNHLCDLLLDQNYGATVEKYRLRVPKACKILAGVQYALLRPEFAQWRAFSLQRRTQNAVLNHLLITLGGVDAKNDTGLILQALARLPSNPLAEITVVMGATAPHLNKVIQLAKAMPIKTLVVVDVANMAERMAHADLAIGAAGATTWERCCLGLPTIQMVIAENQRLIAQALARDGVVQLMEHVDQLADLMPDVRAKLSTLSEKSSNLSDGLGCVRVVQNILESSP